ncbi:MAG: thioredoxin fold domain-containing protein [candidate division Zixibacteria bacterium]
MRSKQWIITMAVVAVGIFLFAGIGSTDNKESKEVIELNWVKYDKGLELAAKANKPIMVDFYTNWCKFCKKMDKETFAEETVAKYLNENFVIIKVNAESKETVITADGSLSERALSKSFGVRGYPAYWFLKPDGEKISNIPGYVPADKFIIVLQYFAEGHYETKTLKDYFNSLQSN